MEGTLIPVTLCHGIVDLRLSHKMYVHSMALMRYPLQNKMEKDALVSFCGEKPKMSWRKREVHRCSVRMVKGLMLLERPMVIVMIEDVKRIILDTQTTDKGIEGDIKEDFHLVEYFR